MVIICTAIWNINTLPSHVERRDCYPMQCWPSRLTTFYYTTPFTCFCQLVWLTYRFKVIDSLMLDAWVSSYKQTDRSWPPIFWTVRRQQKDPSCRYSLCFPSVAIVALRTNFLQKDDILCELYAYARSDISDYSENESLDSDSDSDVPTTSSRKQLRSSTGSLIPQFPHTFFLTLWVGTVLNPFGRPAVLVATASKHRIQSGYSKFGPCVNILYRNLGQFTVQNKNCQLMKPWSHCGVAWNLQRTIQGK